MSVMPLFLAPGESPPTAAASTSSPAAPASSALLVAPDGHQGVHDALVARAHELSAQLAVLPAVPAQARIAPTTTVPMAPPEAPRAPTREVGYAVSNGTSWWGQVAEEETPELQWPLSIEVFDRMRRTDAQVTSVLRAVTMPLRRTRWYIEPNGAPDDVVIRVAQDLGLPIAGADLPLDAPVRSRDRFSWPEHLSQALEMLTFGFSYFEQLYRLDGDGYARLRKLAHRPAATISKINVATDGGLDSIEQRPPAGWTDTLPPTIPVSRLVAYVHERVGGNWRGTSLLRPAYKHWLLKDRLLRVGTETVERNGMGVPLYTGAEGQTSLSNGTELAQQWSAGSSAGGGIPYGSKLQLLTPDSTLPDALAPVRYHDEQIGRAVLAHFLNLGQQTGSWALGSTFADFFTLSLQTLGMLVADVGTHHVIEDLVDVNYGPATRAPRLAFDEIGSRQVATAQAVALLVSQGILRADESLEGAMRSTLGLPAAAGLVTPTPAGAGGLGFDQ